MRARNQIDEAVRITKAIDYEFSLDLIVHTLYTMEWRPRACDWFLKEIMDQGVVLYEKVDERMDEERGTRHADRGKT